MPGDGPAEGAVKIAILDAVTARKKKPEPAAEEVAVKEMVRQAMVPQRMRNTSNGTSVRPVLGVTPLFVQPL
jgi:hypothetical protein